jgi:hypothetical protein
MPTTGDVVHYFDRSMETPGPHEATVASAHEDPSVLSLTITAPGRWCSRTSSAATITRRWCLTRRAPTAGTGRRRRRRQSCRHRPRREARPTTRRAKAMFTIGAARRFLMVPWPSRCLGAGLHRSPRRRHSHSVSERLSTAVDLDSLGLSAPRTRGRAARPPVATLGRELTPADIALLETERGTKAPRIAKLRGAITR